MKKVIFHQKQKRGDGTKIYENQDKINFMHEGRTPQIVFKFMASEPGKAYSPKELSQELQGKSVGVIRKALSRLARKGYIKRIQRGKYVFIPPQWSGFLNDVEMVKLIIEISDILIKRCHIPDNVKNREILRRNIEKALSEIDWK